MTWDLLEALTRSGIYQELERYDTVEMIPGVKWKCDFTMVNRMTGSREWAEAKGMEGERYRIILQLWRHLGPGKLTIYKADRRGNPVVADEIVPAWLKRAE